MLTFAVIQVLIGFVGSALAGEFIDLRQETKDPTSAEYILARRRGAQDESAKSAYLFYSLVLEDVRGKNDPTLDHSDAASTARLQHVYDDVTSRMDGYSLRGGYLHAALKDLAAAGAQVPGVGVFWPSNLVGKVVDDATDGMSASPLMPTVNTNLTIGANAWAYSRRNGKDPLSKFTAKGLRHYQKDVNLNDLELNRDVQEVRDRLKSDAGVKGVKNDVARLGERTKHLNEETTALAEHLAYDMAEDRAVLNALARDYAQRQREADRERDLAQRRDNLAKQFGTAALFMEILGAKELAQDFDRAGQVALRMYDTFGTGLSFNDNPTVFCYNYVALAASIQGFFAKQKPDPRWTALFGQLQELRGLIIAMGMAIESHLDEIHADLKHYIRDSTFRLKGLQTQGTQSADSDRFFQDALLDLQRTTHASALFSGNLALNQMRSECFNLSAAGLWADRERDRRIDKCRDDFTTYAIYGPAAGRASNAPFETRMLEHLVKRLPRSLGMPPDLRMIPDAAGWMTGVNGLLRLAELYPDAKARLARSNPASESELSLATVLSVGEYFGTVGHEAALTGTAEGGYRLRRSLIDSIVNDYEHSVQAALKTTAGLVNANMAGAPHPRAVDLGNGPNVDPSFYRFLDQPIGMCDEDSKYIVPPNVQVFRAGNLPYPAFNPKDFRMGPAFLPLIPKVVLYALTSDFSDDHQSLIVRPCFTHFGIPEMDAHVDSGRMIMDTKFMAVLQLEVSYVFNGQPKKLMVASYFMQSIFTSSYLSPMVSPGLPARMWHGLEPFNRDIAVGQHPERFFEPKVYDDTQSGFDEFKRDFNSQLNAVDHRVLETLETMDGQDQARSKLILDELRFVLEQGVAANSDEVARLLGYIADPAVLMPAGQWAKAYYVSGVSAAIVHQDLRQRLDRLRELLDAVEKRSDLRPTKSVFDEPVRRLKEIEATKTSSWNPLKWF